MREGCQGQMSTSTRGTFSLDIDNSHYTHSGRIRMTGEVMCESVVRGSLQHDSESGHDTAQPARGQSIPRRFRPAPRTPHELPRSLWKNALPGVARPSLQAWAVVFPGGKYFAPSVLVPVEARPPSLGDACALYPLKTMETGPRTRSRAPPSWTLHAMCHGMQERTASESGGTMESSHCP